MVCGYTPYYTTAVWVGRDDNRIMESLSGASYPKSIWSNFMNAIHSEYSSTDSMGGNYRDYQGETTQQTGTQATTATESSTKGTEATTAAPTTAAPTTAALRQRLLQRQHHRQKNSQQRISKKNIEIIKNHR